MVDPAGLRTLVACKNLDVDKVLRIVFQGSFLFRDLKVVRLNYYTAHV